MFAAVEPVLANLRAKVGDLYAKAEPTIGPYVDKAGAAFGRLAANLRSLATEAADKLQKLSKDIPVGSSGSLHDILFGDAEAKVQYQ